MRKQTRAERFREIRDEVLKHTHRMQPVGSSELKLRCGPFLILYSLPGSRSNFFGFNLNIWPAGQVGFGGMVIHGHKVANVDWDQHDDIDILSYRSGPWEQELLQMLRSGDKIVPFNKRRRDCLDGAVIVP